MKKVLWYTGIITISIILSAFVFVNINKKDISKKCSISRIEKDLKTIINTPDYRNHENTIILNQVAGYIKSEFEKISDTVWYQKYKVRNKEYKNVVCSIGRHHKQRIIIGAHYDVCGNQDGADDNASGVAGLLELARMLKDDSLKYRIDFVAYTLEEPPYYDTKNMGSYIHAKYIADMKYDVKGMICLEMIGYFNEEKNSQDYPASFLKMFYGNKGDFITVVQPFGNGKFGRRVKRLMKKPELIKTKSFKAPASLTSINLSDHKNYWAFSIPAVMITNTAFYRNKNYHTEFDKMETLNLPKMAAVIDQVYYTVSTY